jgi:hypothetical protein
VDASALLHDVRRLVRRGEQIGGSRERHAVARGVGGRADRGRGLAAGATDLRADARDVVVAERALDGVVERQR